MLHKGITFLLRPACDECHRSLPMTKLARTSVWREITRLEETSGAEIDHQKLRRITAEGYPSII